MKILCFGGFKNVGKSYLGQIMAQKYQLSFIDLDKECEQSCKMPISHIYKNLGKDAFHKLELSILQQLCYHEPTLLALGGSTLLSLDNLEFLKTKGEIVILEASFDQVKHRILHAKNLWALVDPLDVDNSIQKLYEQRSYYYNSLGFKIFRVDDKDQIAQLGNYVGQFFR